MNIIGYTTFVIEFMCDVYSEKETQEAWALAAEHSRLADLYHAFHHVHSFTTDPFTALQPEVLLQASLTPMYPAQSHD